MSDGMQGPLVVMAARLFWWTWTTPFTPAIRAMLDEGIARGNEVYSRVFMVTIGSLTISLYHQLAPRWRFGMRCMTGGSQ